MSSKLTIGTVNVAPGEKAYGGIETNTSVFGEKEINNIYINNIFAGSINAI